VQANSPLENAPHSSPLGQSRMTRLWLLALLALTGLTAGGVLFAKYQLESFRAVVQDEIGARTGVFVDAKRVRVDGLRGLQMGELHLAIASEGGPAVDIYVPDALLLVNLAELLQGRVTISRIQLDDARIVLTRPRGRHWFTGDLNARSALAGTLPFRAVGNNCTVEFKHIVGDTDLKIEALNFDLNRLDDSPHLIANLEGKLGAESPGGFEIFARYASLENFDLRIQSDTLDSQDLAPYFPMLGEQIAAGMARPSIRVSGHPRQTMVVGLELPFEGLALHGAQDYPVPPAGVLTALASYDMNAHLLTLNTAKTLSPDFEGQIAGTVDFATDPPSLDLKMEVQQFAMDDILALASGTWLEERGTLALAATDPYRFFLTVQGPLPGAEIGVEAQLGHGSLQFTPSAAGLPEADLQFNLLSMSWRSDTQGPEGRISLSGGTVTHGKSGLAAEGITGTALLRDGKIRFAPLVAQVAGNTVRGSIDYVMETETLTLDLSGDLAAVEEIGPLANHPDLDIRGPATIERLTGTITPRRYILDTSLDLTRTYIGWEWWLAKRPGVGARIQDLHIDIVPEKTMDFTGSAALDTARISAAGAFKRDGNSWALQTFEADSPELEMRTADKFFQIPYTIAGGKGTEATLRWRRLAAAPEHTELGIGGRISELSLMPEGSATPITGADIAVETTIVRKGEDRTGTLNLRAASAALPPFGSPWLLPLRDEDDPSHEEFPAMDRHWSYSLQADVLAYPPWSGTAFSGAAFTSPTRSGFESFRAIVGEGSVSGMYTSTRPDNVHKLDAEWENVPASHLLEHLKLPAIFSGTMTGGIAYSIDKDDPGTLRGTGYFDVSEGQFSADYLFAQFQSQIEASSITLPPSMRFSCLSADVALEGDLVKTTNMLLESDAVRISGQGQFISGGDLDYHIKLSIPPETARGVPALRANFNLEGLRHSQTNLELAFRIHGPGFAPRMELAGMPSIGDTIVSGAVGLTSDVIKVVDLPRQILIDLFKIGGGIVGAGGRRTPAE